MKVHMYVSSTVWLPVSIPYQTMHAKFNLMTFDYFSRESTVNDILIFVLKVMKASDKWSDLSINSFWKFFFPLCLSRELITFVILMSSNSSNFKILNERR